MLENIFEPSIANLRDLTSEQAVFLMRDILHAEARMISILPTAINIPTAITVADGGIDADVTTDSIDEKKSKGLIFPGVTCYQIKTGTFSASTDAEIRELIFKPGRRTKKKVYLLEDMQERVRACLDRNGTFVIVLFGVDRPEKKENAVKNKIIGELIKVSSQYQDAKIHILRPNQLVKILADHFPGKALSLKGISSPHIHSLKYIKECGNLDGQNNYLQTTKIKAIISQIQDKLINASELIHIRFVGEPGIGKTHLIYEAIKQSEFEPIALYSDNPEQLFNSGEIHRIYDLAQSAKFILILDECEPKYRTKLHQIFQNIQTPVVLITIHHEQEEQDNKDSYFSLSPEPLDQNEISKILESYRVPFEQACHIAHLCSGSPRVAHIVGKHLMSHPDAISLTKINGLENIWNKYIAGTEDTHSQEYRTQHLILSFLALFRKFGWEEDVSEEANIIYGLIVKYDNNSTLSIHEFKQVIKRIRSRKILQGNTTLYITPKLLQIKLWSDWWENYGNQINIKDFLNELNNPLRQWFNEMFIYAKQSKSAEKTVQYLLGPEGPFYNLESYTNEVNGSFFLMLASVNPKAAVRAIKNALGTKSPDELIRLQNGRRPLIHALEQIALYEDFFEDAAECLLRLAEAENESWSNNATGVFSELFTLGYGNVASTSLSPKERLNILNKYIHSPSEIIRDIILKSFDNALRIHFIRRDIRYPIGLNPTPKGWMPKDNEEVVEVYRDYLNALWSARKKFKNQTHKDKVTQIILGHSRSLMSISALDKDILSIFEELSKENEMTQPALVQAIVTILHYDKKALDDEIIKKLEGIHDFLSERSYSSKLHRYVGLNLLEDRYNVEPENHIEMKLEVLAKEVYECPDLLKNEYSWLVTKLAQNGYEFGKKIGEHDKDILFWDSIYAAWLHLLPNSSELFISGYLMGVFSINQEKWEYLINEISKGDGVSQIPYLIFRSGMTSNIAGLLLTLAEKEAYEPYELRGLIYNNNIKNISIGILLAILDLLLKKGGAKNIYAALEIMYGIFYSETQSIEAIIDMCIKILSHPIFFMTSNTNNIDTMIDFYWKELVLWIVQYDLNRVMFLVDKCLDFLGVEGTILGGIQSQSLEFLDFVVKKDPQAVWTLIIKKIDPPLKSQRLSIMQWLKGGFIRNYDTKRTSFASFSQEDILEWVNEKPTKRAELIAHFIPVELNRPNDQKPSLARILLENYGATRAVRSSLHASFHTESWSGRASNHYQKKLASVEALEEVEENKNVRRWLQEEIEYLRQTIKTAKIREEREE